MTQVRPTQLPTVAAPPPNRPQPGSFGDLAAAFRAALTGQAQASAPAPAPPALYAQPVQRLPDPAGEAPTRILRPGSLLDIRV